MTTYEAPHDNRFCFTCSSRTLEWDTDFIDPHDHSRHVFAYRCMGCGGRDLKSFSKDDVSRSICEGIYKFGR